MSTSTLLHTHSLFILFSHSKRVILFCQFFSEHNWSIIQFVFNHKSRDRISSRHTALEEFQYFTMYIFEMISFLYMIISSLTSLLPSSFLHSPLLFLLTVPHIPVCWFTMLISAVLFSPSAMQHDKLTRRTGSDISTSSHLWMIWKGSPTSIISPRLIRSFGLTFQQQAHNVMVEKK